MAVDYNPVKMATEMMRSALVLLDDVGETHAAIELQHAIGILTREPVPQPELGDAARDQG